jgi:hypothetical protein
MLEFSENFSPRFSETDLHRTAQTIMSKTVTKMVPIDEIRPSPENAKLYRPVSSSDAATIALAKSIKREAANGGGLGGSGILEPLVESADGYLLSGHRRLCAASMLDLREVPVRVDADIRRGNGETASSKFLLRLREYNRQRVKSRDELLREAIASVDPKKAHRALRAHRKQQSKIKLDPIELREASSRCIISPAKKPLLDAIKRIIKELEDFWPLNLRQIHYQLLNDPPLTHASKPHSTYRNNLRSYAKLSDVLTRARTESYIDYELIDDPTRPVTLWNVHRDLSSYYEEQMQDLLNDYWRDLLQSQPNHIELVVEKNTLQNIVQPIASEYCLPMTFGRGQCSTRPIYNIAQRYRKSGKTKLVILAMSDLDPDGDVIAHSIAQRLRDDHKIEAVELFKVALTMTQRRDLELTESPFQKAKESSPNYQRYIETYETDSVWELEALDPSDLQRLLREAIEAVINRRAFNTEVEAESKDAAHNEAVRETILESLQDELEQDF